MMLASASLGTCRRCARLLRRWSGSSTLSASSNAPRPPVSIVVHGGAWAIPDAVYDESQAGVAKAARIGFEVLHAGGSAIDAVQASVESLESNPVFDAGVGSVLNEDGDVEMDALIMDGATLAVGSVIGVNNLEHPIHLARLVMERTHHVAFQGAGASRLADEFGLERIPQSRLVTDAAVEEWKLFKQYNHSVDKLFNSASDHDTVGCVALDRAGNVACGTSTGGITAKKCGRVGDSPLIGSGGYATNEVGGVSTTGHGESIAKVVLAQRILNIVDNRGCSIQEAAEAALSYMRKRVKGSGGVVCLDMHGRPGIAHTTKRMAWAHIRQDVDSGAVSESSGMNHEAEFDHLRSVAPE